MYVSGYVWIYRGAEKTDSGTCAMADSVLRKYTKRPLPTHTTGKAKR